MPELSSDLKMQRMEKKKKTKKNTGRLARDGEACCIRMSEYM